MSSGSKADEPAIAGEVIDEAAPKSKAPEAVQVESDHEEEDQDDEPVAEGTAASAAPKKKKKSKKKRIKDVLTGGNSESSTSGSKDKISKAAGGLSHEQISTMLELNPGLAHDLGFGDLPMSDVAEKMKKLDLSDIMTGLAMNGKNVKDMGAYKFWGTQPVPKFGENKDIKEGPFKIIEVEKVAKEPGPLLDGFEWVTMDITNEGEVREIFELLFGHYVEDNDARFRFNYSPAFLKWALQAPGWTPDWHVGVRATTSRKLVAFISAVPVELRVRKKVLHASEVNFLCIHKKLRSKRLAPVLIKEVTRRCYLKGVFQAVYTAGVVLPTPVSTCRYFHRSINWQKLNDIGFSPLPHGSKPSWQIAKYQLPDKTSTKGLRVMESKDIGAVNILLKKYLDRFEMAPEFTKEEIDHLMIHKGNGEQVVWAYVVEDPSSKKITDFFSFYNIESSVVQSTKHKLVRAAYVFYYATTVALSASTLPKLPERLNELMNDALILAKKANFDVFNALTLCDNTLFLEQQKFGPGDGQLHYYLYNYLANPIAGGVNKQNNIDSHGSGVGLVML